MSSSAVYLTAHQTCTRPAQGGAWSCTQGTTIANIPLGMVLQALGSGSLQARNAGTGIHFAGRFKPLHSPTTLTWSGTATLAGRFLRTINYSAVGPPKYAVTAHITLTKVDSSRFTVPAGLPAAG